MLNLKDRIAILKNKTTSPDAVEIANAALEACKSNGFMDSVIAENLVKDLTDIDDTEVKRFVQREQRFIDISNLGVKEAYANLLQGDLMHYPTIKPLIESMGKAIGTLPEYQTAANFVNSLQQYSWNKELKADLTKIMESIEKYKEDIQLANFMYEFKNSSGSYLSKMFVNELDTYFIDRTASNRKAVLEKINPYLFDSYMKHLHDVLVISEDGFQVRADGEVSIEKIYSPVLINENEEVFFASGRFLKKTATEIKSLSGKEIEKLPEAFVNLSYFMAQPNVTVFENKILVTTESGNKSVEIITEGENAILKLNGKEMQYQTFTKYFINEGILRSNDNAVLQQIAVLYENINNIYEVDYGKRLVSKIQKGQWVDIYKVDKSVFITKVDESQKINEFVSNINAHQTKELVLEYLRFDISESLRDLLPAETEKLNNLKTQKDELSEAIKLLAEKKESVIQQVNENAILRANPEIKELLEAIDMEINTLNEHKNAASNMIKSMTTVQMFSDEEFTNESFIDNYWKNADKNTVLYFAQEDEDGKYLVGTQTYKWYKDNSYWEPIETNLSKDAAIKIAKDKAAKDKFGQYIETEDVMENVIIEGSQFKPGDEVKLEIEEDYYDYGTVIKCNGATCHVKWEDGSETKNVKCSLIELKESKDPDGVDKLHKQNNDMNLSNEIKKNEDNENPLESGDEVRLKNGKVGVVQGNDSGNNTIILMEDGKSVAVPQEYLHEIEIIKKKSNEDKPEVKTTDGAQSVEIREGKDDEWIDGIMIDKKGKEGDKILINALDYTSRGDSEEIKIKTGNSFDKAGKTLKKFIKVVG